MVDDCERIILVKPEVFVYKIPPLVSNRGQRAADWKLDSPDWTGRLRVALSGEKILIKLEDKSGGLFAKAPITKYPGVDIEPVSDSSRYFVLRLQDDSGRSAFIGIGFADRGDSFDLNVALQDHFKNLEKEKHLITEETQNPSASESKLDLGLREGQTITLNIGKKSTSGTARPRSAANATGSVPLLPPPPATGSRIIAPPPVSRVQNLASAASQSKDEGLLQYTYGDSSNSNNITSSRNPVTNIATASSASRFGNPQTSLNQEAVGNLLDL